MRAILIDPVAETVMEVEHNGDYRNIYDLIDCETFTVVGIDNDDAIYVDDEGLLKDDPKHFFMFSGYAQPLAGKGLILGTDEEGNSVSPIISIEEVIERVTFVRLRLERFDDISCTIDHPLLGPDTPMIGHRPVFSMRDKEDDN